MISDAQSLVLAVLITHLDDILVDIASRAGPETRADRGEFRGRD